MQYLDQERNVAYTAKDGKPSRIFPALQWMVVLSSHIPNRGKQMVRCYGYYSNISWRKRKDAGKDDVSPASLNCRGIEGPPGNAGRA